MKAVVFGASGGLGSTFVRKLANSYDEVFAVSRKQTTFDQANVTSLIADITEEKSLEELATKLPQELDAIIVATGVLHDEDGLFPEKSLKDLSKEKFLKSFTVNTIGPSLVGKLFAPRLNKSQKSIFAAVTGRVGSIGDNRMGGWYSYRASKAALHMVIRNIAIELGRKNKQAVVLSLHPGTVDTGLSKPFQSGVPEGKLFTPEYSVDMMLNVIDKATPAESGSIFAYDGTIIEY